MYERYEEWLLRPLKTVLIIQWASEVALVYFSGKFAVMSFIIIIMTEIMNWKRELAAIRYRQELAALRKRNRKLNRSSWGIMRDIFQDICELVGRFGYVED